MKAKGNLKFVNKDKNLFFTTLKKRIDAYFKDEEKSKHANTQMVVKSVILILAYMLPFAILLIFHPSFNIAWILWVISGLGLAGVGMSVMHDAIHGAYSPNDTINKIMGYSLNLCGASILNWKLQHNVLHHTYTNVVSMDDDIADKLVLKFSPNTPVKGYHKYQPYYAFLFYGILTLYWITLKDFIQFFQYTANGVNKNDKKENTFALIKIILIKAIYFFIIFFVPIYFLNFSFTEILLGFLVMHFVAGIILTLVFQMAHAVEDAEHPQPNANGDLENDWAIHQMKTTVNFSPNNKFLRWYLGGLNYQVEHHVFPKISHVHYPAISPIVKQTAEEFGVPYKQNQTFWIAFKSHMKSLKKVGLPSFNEALSG